MGFKKLCNLCINKHIFITLFKGHRQTYFSFSTGRKTVLHGARSWTVESNVSILDPDYHTYWLNFVCQSDLFNYGPKADPP